MHLSRNWVSADDLEKIVDRAINEGWPEFILLGPSYNLQFDELDSWPDSASREDRVFQLATSVKGLAEFIAKLNKITKLDLINCDIDDDDVGVIARSCTQLTSLNLSRNKIGNDGVKAIAASLTQLAALNLSFNRVSAHRIGVSDEGAEALVQSLSQLMKLNLHSNNIGADGAKAIAQASSQLTSLDLGGNKIGADGAQAIARSLPQLTSLDLSSSQIGDDVAIAISQSLCRLKSLDLSSCEISCKGAKAIAQSLAKLAILDLSYNDIGIDGIEAIAQSLTQLRSLSMVESGIDERGAEAIAKLSELETLDLHDNQIGDDGASALGTLSRLVRLELWNNEISYAGAQELSKLSQLEVLYLSYNRIGPNGAKAIANLVQLRSLDLSSCEIGDDGAKALGALTELTRLSLGYNGIGDNGAKGLGSLNQLTTLELWNNQVGDDGAKALGGLTDLMVLELQTNKIGDEGAKALGNLSQLVNLDLRYNEIGDEGAQGLAKLTELRSLQLGSNKIGDDGAEALIKLTKLKALDLTENKITQIQRDLVDLPWLEYLFFRGNPIQDVDAELYNSLDTPLQSLRDYFRGLDRGSVRQDQVKLLLVGNGGVGKTSIVNRLLDDRFDSEQTSTHGIQIRSWSLNDVAPERLGDKPTKVSVWDFAGQDIYHATHRLFMRTRALFLLVWDKVTECSPANGDEEYQNFRLPYWIDYIRALSGSPVVIVQNKVDCDADKDLAYGQDLQERYPPPCGITGYHYVSARQPSHNGMAALVANIQQAYGHLEGIGNLLPKQWVLIRDELVEMRAQGTRIIDYERFEAMCSEAGLKETEPETLADYLHQSGVLYYRRDSFGKRILLDQQWAIDGVYAVLDRQSDHARLLRAKAPNGLAFEDFAETVWRDYPAEDQWLFLIFMTSCELAFEYRQGVFYIPQLLPNEKPGRVADRWREPTSYMLQIRYDFLHRGIIERFIVQTGRHIEEPYPDDIWRNGIVILHQSSDTRALVEAFPEDRKILVHAKGNAPQTLLCMIQKQLVDLHDEFAPDISFSADAGEHFIDERDLRKFAEAKAEKVPAIDDGPLIELAPLKVFLRHSDEKLPEAPVKPPLVTDEEIFLSYAWGDPSETGESREAIVDRLYETLSLRRLRVVRDKRDNGYRKIISDFMRRIGQGRLVVVVISDKYLRSPYCMYELLDVYQNGAFHERVFPIVLGDTAVYDLADRLRYVKYWKDKKKEIEDLITDIGLDAFSSVGTFKEYDLFYRRIFNNVDKLLKLLADWNSLTPQLLEENKFEHLVKEIEKSLH